MYTRALPTSRDTFARPPTSRARAAPPRAREGASDPHPRTGSALLRIAAARAAESARAPGPARPSAPLPLQARLEVADAADPREREADRVAEAVMRTRDGESPGRAAEGAGPWRSAAGAPPARKAPPEVHETLGRAGDPLEPADRAFMEARFGADFGGVRVHADAQAARSARAVSALAYTVGRDVVFARGQYAPGTRDTRRLLAHELAHVVQQGGASASGVGAGPVPGAGATLQRQPAPTAEVVEPPPPVFGTPAPEEAEPSELQSGRVAQPRTLLPRRVVTDHASRWISPAPGYRVQRGMIVVDTRLSYDRVLADQRDKRYYVVIRGTANDGSSVFQETTLDFGVFASTYLNVPPGTYQVEVGVYEPIMDYPFQLEVTITWRPPRATTPP